MVNISFDEEAAENINVVAQKCIKSFISKKYKNNKNITIL